MFRLNPVQAITNEFSEYGFCIEQTGMLATLGKVVETLTEPNIKVVGGGGGGLSKVLVVHQ